MREAACPSSEYTCSLVETLKPSIQSQSRFRSFQHCSDEPTSHFLPFANKVSKEHGGTFTLLPSILRKYRVGLCEMMVEGTSDWAAAAAGTVYVFVYLFFNNARTKYVRCNFQNMHIHEISTRKIDANAVYYAANFLLFPIHL